MKGSHEKRSLTIESQKHFRFLYHLEQVNRIHL